jgi:hypothetical protein
MLYVEFLRGVVDGAVAVVVVADGAVEHVILEDSVEGLALRDVDILGGGFYLHSRLNPGGAGAYEFTVDLDDAGIATLDGAHLRNVADLWNRLLGVDFSAAVEQLNEQLARMAWNLEPIDGQLSVWRVIGGSVQQ